MTLDLRVGTAGWQIPRAVRDRFADAPSGLERYATRLTCVEINSTFYRSHQASTYQRWAEQTPEGFRFAVKAPKTVTHERRLKDAKHLMAAFLAETAQLGSKRGPVLVQLPASLAFDKQIAAAFFTMVRALYDGPVACEPRGVSWFEAEADDLLRSHRVARVGADPATTPAAAEPGGWDGLSYRRLHGSPRLYSTPYRDDQLVELAGRMAADRGESWCVFDNTMSGAAAENALDLTARLGG